MTKLISPFARIIFVLPLALTASCTNETPPVGPGCGGLSAGAKVDMFLAASDNFAGMVGTLSADLEASCDAIAADLELEIPVAAEGQRQVEVTCNAVAAEIEVILGASLPDGASLVVDVQEPRCSVDIGAVGDCVAECDGSLMGMANVTCEGGELSGTCTGECDGTCSIEGTVTCATECRGTCDGSCSGTCTGACDGTCSATDSSGDCVGTCEGTCMGRCSADCIGTCSGTCESDVSGGCGGTCTGTCDVELQEPRCSGDADLMADAQCEAACEVDVRGQVVCTEPTVAISTTELVDLGADARLADLIASLHRNYPRLLSVAARLEANLEAGQTFVASLEALAEAGPEISAQAAACLTVAAAGAADAVGQLGATVDVSVSVTASASVSGGASL